MLLVEELSVEVAGTRILDSLSFAVRRGDKVGLVGRNGAGKTTLLKVVAGEAAHSGGEITRKGDLGYLPQEPRVRLNGKAQTALQYVLSGKGLDRAAVEVEELRGLAAADPSEQNVTRFTRAEDSYASSGGYSAEPEARRIAAGLGLPASRLGLPVAVLSGGERRRVELSRILFSGSEVLLLDEPTNHLDVDARNWLLAFLRSYRGALLIVSHDLALLDRSITRVLHLEREGAHAEGHLTEYKGNYSQYRAARLRDEQRRAKLAQRQQGEISRLSTLADSMRHQTAKRARIAKSLDTRVSKLRGSAVTAARKERRIKVRFPEPPRSGKVVLEVEGLTKSYGTTPVFDGISFTLGRGERLLAMGLNGAGKTSLLRILAGETEADEGDVTPGVGVSMGYYAQEHEGIISGKPVLEHLIELSEAPVAELRTLMGTFGLSGSIAFQDAGTLSGGEKTKLALTLLVSGRHNLLLLDEPTNNLDPPSRDAIANALASWPGAMVIVSHDTEFVEQLAPDRVLMMPEGTVDYWSNDLVDLVALA